MKNYPNLITVLARPYNDQLALLELLSQGQTLTNQSNVGREFLIKKSLSNQVIEQNIIRFPAGYMSQSANYIRLERKGVPWTVCTIHGTYSFKAWRHLIEHSVGVIVFVSLVKHVDQRKKTMKLNWEQLIESGYVNPEWFDELEVSSKLNFNANMDTMSVCSVFQTAEEEILMDSARIVGAFSDVYMPIPEARYYRTYWNDPSSLITPWQDVIDLILEKERRGLISLKR